MVAGGRLRDHDQDRRRGPEREGRVLTPSRAPRIAITTDWLTSFGGAERVLQNLHALYPHAPVYTSVFDSRKVPADMRAWDVRPSVLQRLPMVHAYSRALLPFMPWAFQRLD